MKTIVAKLIIGKEERELTWVNLDYHRYLQINGKPNSRVEGGFIALRFEPRANDDFFLEWMFADRQKETGIDPRFRYYKTKDGVVAFYENDFDGRFLFKYDFEEGVPILYREVFSNERGMEVFMVISAPIQRFRSKEPYVKQWYEKWTPPREKEKVEKEEEPTLLVVRAEGKKEALPNEEVVYKVTGFNIWATEEDRKRIRWVVKVDNRKEEQKQKGITLKLKIKKEWVGKEITVMPYLQQPTESVSVKTKVKGVKLPILIARSMRRAGITKNSNGKDVTREDITNLRFSLPADKEKLRTKLNEAYDKLGYEAGWFRSYNEKRKSRVKYALDEIESYNKKSDDELFRIMINDLDDWSMGDLDDNLVRMVKFFKLNKSSSNNYKDKRLTKAIAKHSSTKNFINGVAPLIGSAIKEAKGDISLLKVKDEKTQFTKKDLDKDKTIIGIKGLQKLNSLKYSDKLSGLGISVNGIQAYNIYLIEFKRVGSNYKGKFKLEILDHFGLDGTDILGDSFYDQEEFTCWYILQHLRNYKPFITKIEITYSFTGTINSNKLNLKRDEL